MKKAKFKIGDRVELVGEDGCEGCSIAKTGMVGTVIGRPFPESIAIDFDGVPRHQGLFGDGWYFAPKNLVLVKGE